MLHVLSILSVIAIIIYQIIGFYIYKLDAKAKLNRLFAVLCQILTIWSLAHTFLYFSRDIEVFWAWTKLAAVGWCFFHPLCFHLMLMFTRNQVLLNSKYVLPLVYSSAALFFGWITLFLGPAAGHFEEEIFVIAFRAYYLIIVAMMIIMIWKWSRQSNSNRERLQARVIILTGSITLFLAFTTETFFPVMVAGQPADYTHLIILILIGGLWHAIRHFGLFSLSDLIRAEDILTRVTELVAVVDIAGIIIKVNPALEKITGYSKENLVGQSVDILTRRPFSDIYPVNEYKIGKLNIYTRLRTPIPLQVCASSIYDRGGDVLGFVLVGQDMRLVKKLKSEIANRKKNEQELEYLSFHDQLTGVYNRTFFEKEVKRLSAQQHYPVGVVIADVDGLKFVNDTFGHDKGDELLLAATGILKNVIAERGLIARIGGDEFAILLTNFDNIYINQLEQCLSDALGEYNKLSPLIPLSISTGIAVSYHEYRDIMKLFKVADNNMYKLKLNQSSNARSTMVQALLSALSNNGVETGDHAGRLKQMAIELGRKVGMSKYELSELSLLAQFHDLGKVGIPEHILMKPGPLTAAEWTEVSRHSEIGYRIAQSAPELVLIARLILLHHEHWDGKGYPLGLAGEEIPLACRIFAIVDAYDAMTNDRPYRKALRPEQALDELCKNLGTQFDPALIAEFLEMMKERSAKQ